MCRGDTWLRAGRGSRGDVRVTGSYSPLPLLEHLSGVHSALRDERSRLLDKKKQNNRKRTISIRELRVINSAVGSVAERETTKRTSVNDHRERRDRAVKTGKVHILITNTLKEKKKVCSEESAFRKGNSRWPFPQIHLS